MLKKEFAYFDHQADIGIRGFGISPDQAFANAAKAMFNVIVQDLQTIRPEKKEEIEAKGYDLESLLVNWLNNLLTRSDLNRIIFSGFEVKIRGFSLKSECWGEGFDPKRHFWDTEVKGATLSQVEVVNKKGLWIAQCVVDV